MAATTERRRDLLRLLQDMDDETRASAIQQIALGGVEAGAEVYDYVSLGDFADREDVLWTHAPVGYVAAAAVAAAAAAANVPVSHVEERSLSPRAQVLIWQVIDAFCRMLDLDLCPASVTADNIKVDMISLRPKLIGLNNLLPKTPARVENLMRDLAQIFEDGLLIRGHPAPVSPLPLEIRHLLRCMRDQAVALLPVIRYHPALVPVENRGDYLGRMHKYTRDVLKKNDRTGYDYVMRNVSCPRDWGARLKINTYLDNFFKEANKLSTAHEPYNAQGTSAANPSGISVANNPQMKAEAEKESNKESVRFNRNFGEHGLEMSADKHSKGGMRFTVCEMAHMLYSLMDGILCSVATSLQRLSIFTDVPDIPSLFPGRVVEKNSK